LKPYPHVSLDCTHGRARARHARIHTQSGRYTCAPGHYAAVASGFRYARRQIQMEGHVRVTVTRLGETHDGRAAR